MATIKRMEHKRQRMSEVTLSDIQRLPNNVWPKLDPIDEYSTAARRYGVNCGSGEMLVRTEIGYLICAESDHALLSSLLDGGEPERGTRLLIERYLKPEDVYVDAGASIGMHTIAAARAMRGRGKTIAFEPHEQTSHMLEKSVWMNGFHGITEIYQAAASNSVDQQKIFADTNTSHHSLLKLDHSPNIGKNTAKALFVRLDSIINKGQRIDLIKTDIKGTELEIIEAGSSIIDANPEIALIAEFNPARPSRTGKTPEQWPDSLPRLGLTYKLINGKSGEVENWSPDALKSVDSLNIFFAFKQSSAWSRLK
jgi:FkbM family methyltransferase